MIERLVCSLFFIGLGSYFAIGVLRDYRRGKLTSRYQGRLHVFSRDDQPKQFRLVLLVHSAAAVATLIMGLLGLACAFL